MELSAYDGKYVRIRSIYGDTFSGLAEYGNHSFLECEFGGNEDGIFVEDFLIYNSQIESIEEIEVHGTVEIWVESVTLRRYRPEDAEQLYKYLGKDPEMDRYTGWNPFATREMAEETVRSFIDSYDDEHSYSWIMDIDDVIVGTIGAYDFDVDELGQSKIEVGFTVVDGWRRRGLATEALKKILEYLTDNEGISCVTAWCAADNTASRIVLERSGMRLTGKEKDGITVGDKVYDKLIYEYRK